MYNVYIFQIPNDVEVANVDKKTPRRSLSAPADSPDDKPGDMKLGPRYSLPFVCKTDLDLIKEMNGEAVLDRRISLLMMNERNRARHSMVEGYNDRPLVKKVSTNSMVEGKQYERKLAHHDINDPKQVPAMFTLGSDTTDVTDNSETVHKKKHSKDKKKIKGISTSHVL